MSTKFLRRFAPDAGQRQPLGVGQWVRGQTSVATTRVLTVVLWAAVVVAVLGSLYSAVRPVPTAPAAPKVEPTTGAEGFAVMYVSEWLRADPRNLDALAPFYPQTIIAKPPYLDPTRPPPALEVHTAVALDAQLLNPGYWSVLVAADVSSGPERAVRFYRVPVGRITGRYVAAGLPGETTPPMGGVRVPYNTLASPAPPKPSDPVAIAVTRFMGALLAGQGDITTLSSPGAQVRALTPAPYTTIELLTITSSTTAKGVVEVAATVGATDADGHYWSLGYPLELTQRDDRWEVSRMLPASTLAAEQPDLTPPTTAVTVAPVVSSTVPKPRSTTTTR